MIYTRKRHTSKIKRYNEMGNRYTKEQILEAWPFLSYKAYEKGWEKLTKKNVK